MDELNDEFFMHVDGLIYAARDGNVLKVSYDGIQIKILETAGKYELQEISIEPLDLLSYLSVVLPFHGQLHRIVEEK